MLLLYCNSILYFTVYSVLIYYARLNNSLPAHVVGCYLTLAQTAVYIMG